MNTKVLKYFFRWLDVLIPRTTTRATKKDLCPLGPPFLQKKQLDPHAQCERNPPPFHSWIPYNNIVRELAKKPLPHTHLHPWRLMHWTVTGCSVTRFSVRWPGVRWNLATHKVGGQRASIDPRWPMPLVYSLPLIVLCYLMLCVCVILYIKLLSLMYK